MKRSDIQELERLCDQISNANFRLINSENEVEVDEAIDEFEDYCELVLKKIGEIRDESI
jgi:hypothetical protein